MHDDGGERALGVPDRRLREDGATPLLTASTPVIAVHPLANAEQEPDTGGLGRRRAWPASRATGGGDPPRTMALNDADDDHDAERHDEHVRRQHEREPGLADPAQVDDREEHEDAEADRERVRQQRRNGGDERADAGRDADGDVEDVVDRERGAGDQRRSWCRGSPSRPCTSRRRRDRRRSSVCTRSKKNLKSPTVTSPLCVADHEGRPARVDWPPTSAGRGAPRRCTTRRRSS